MKTSMAVQGAGGYFSNPLSTGKVYCLDYCNPLLVIYPAADQPYYQVRCMPLDCGHPTYGPRNAPFDNTDVSWPQKLTADQTLVMTGV